MNKSAQFATRAVAAALLALAGTAMAATASQAQLQYQQERAACLNGTSNQERATCLKEAGAALQEARRGNLSGGGDRQIGQNRFARCDALPQADRRDCEMRMEGQGSTSGSAQQGGILRELARPVPAQ